MAKKKKYGLTIKNSFNFKFTDNKINNNIIVNLGEGKTILTIKGSARGTF